MPSYTSRNLTLLALGLTVGCTGFVFEPLPADGPGTGSGSGGGPFGATGGGGEPDPTMPGGPNVPAPAVFHCDPAAAVAELPLPRLSKVQLQRSLQAALKLALPASADAIWTQVSAQFARYPDDQRAPAPGDLRGGYTRTDQSIQQTQVDAMYDVGVAIGAQLTSSTARMTTLMGACATDTSTTNDRTCLEAFVTRFGSRVLRSAMSSTDVTWYADIAGTTPVAPAAVADVIAVLLQAPEALYRVEHGTNDAADPAPLSAYELASRMSYLFWQAPPDDELWNAAASGALLNPVTYDAQLARVAKSPSTSAAFDEFFGQWLRLDGLPPLDTLKDDPQFKAFAGAQLPSATSRDAMIGDVLASGRLTVVSGGTLSDFLGDKHAYATDGWLAGLYQVPQWDGQTTAPQFSSSRRSGLLTRAALLSTGTVTTRPIHKGYLVRNALLCQVLGSPPPDANVTPPVPSGTTTTRDAVTARTSPAVCNSCHSIINPPGYITESFDALGRERTEEKVFDASGALVASLPVDTRAVPKVTYDDGRELSDPVELTKAIDASGLYQSCFARHWFRFSQSRNESQSDGCLLAELETAARSGSPIVEVMKKVPQSPSFKQRSFK